MTETQRIAPRTRFNKPGTKHLYCLGVRYPGEDRFEIDVEANNRTQAGSIVKKLGLRSVAEIVTFCAGLEIVPPPH